jgi:DNA-binding response OmpR family regulator
MAKAKKRSTILIVDDTPENLRVLGELLEADGYEVRVATDGPQGRDIAAHSAVDLILLDVMMPGEDGYEVCKQLKASKTTVDIPVVFLTALDSADDEAKGLKLGAVDYITKPFQLGLVRARVANHLALHSARQELKRHNKQLETIVAERTKELAEAHARLLSLDSAKYDFLQLIYQELWASGTGLVDVGRQALGRLDPRSDGVLIARYEEVQTRLFDTLNQALLLAGSLAGDSAPPARPVRLDVVLRDATDKLSAVAASRGVTLTADGTALAAGDLDLVFQSLTTLVHAAVLAADEGSIVEASVAEADGTAVVTLSAVSAVEGWDDAFSPENRFHPSILGRSLGLALPLAAKIAQAQHGSVTASTGKKKHTVTLTLPRYVRPLKGAAIVL